MDESRPIWLQITEAIEMGIIDGSYVEDTQIPSINELAVYYRVNPATALRGVSKLVDDEIIEKRRGVGMFVLPGARFRLRQQRKSDLAKNFIIPLLIEAERLDFSHEELIRLLQLERKEQCNLKGKSNE